MKTKRLTYLPLPGTATITFTHDGAVEQFPSVRVEQGPVIASEDEPEPLAEEYYVASFHGCLL